MKVAGCSSNGKKTLLEKEKCSLLAISTFPIVFSKDLHCRHVKFRVCLGGGWLSDEHVGLMTWWL